ncbi:MAG: hypothetical protein ABRQ25_17595 [Clostridiaceae bacterium]
MKNVKKKIHDFIEHAKKDKVTFAVYVFLRIFVMAAMITQFFNKNYENVFLCIVTLVLFILPDIIEIKFRVELPGVMEVMIILLIFAAAILGEIYRYYLIFPLWDDILHGLNGFLAAAIGFSLVDILNRNEKITFKLSPFFVALVSFCFSMTIGVFWEFFEFAMDMIFKFDMQKDTIVHNISTIKLDPSGRNIPFIINDIQSVTVNGKDLGLGGYLDIGLIDTMKDLIVNFIGAFVFSALGYFYIKKRGNSWWTKFFLIRKSESDCGK